MPTQTQDPKKNTDPSYAESDEDETTGTSAEGTTPKGKTPPPAMEKGGVAPSDLEKSLQALEQFTQEDPRSRKDVLLEKAQNGDLTDEERDELFKALDGKSGGAAPGGDPLSKGLSDNETLQKALDVSDFLQEQHTELCKALDGLSDHVTASDHRQHEFNIVLAKAVSDSGKLIKALCEKLDVVASQPARPPKAAGAGGQPIEKSFAGQPPAGSQINRNQALDAMDSLMEKSMAAGLGGAAETGEDIALAVSKFESTGRMSKSMAALVEKEVRGQ